MKDKLKFFWNITNYLNKKFCKNKLKIGDIILFKKSDLHKSFPNKKGWYFNDKMIIWISQKEPIDMQVVILLHELTHAYQHQIFGEKGHLKHDKKGKKINQMFIDETERIFEKLL